MSADSPYLSAAQEDDAMAKAMTPSETTTIGQINKAVGNYRALLEKHAGEFPSEAVQTVLGMSELTNEMFDLFRKRVEVMSNLTTRHVRVDRTRTPKEAINATGRVKWYIDEQALADMPTEGKEQDDVVVFELDYDPTVDELDREYEARGLRTDPLALAQLMVDDPAFADKRPVAVQWRDKQGRACYADFSRWCGKRGVRVDRSGRWWNRHYRFAGVSK